MFDGPLSNLVFIIRNNSIADVSHDYLAQTLFDDVFQTCIGGMN